MGAWLVGATGDPLASTWSVLAASVVMLLAALAVPDVDFGTGPRPPRSRKTRPSSDRRGGWRRGA